MTKKNNGGSKTNRQSSVEKLRELAPKEPPKQPPKENPDKNK